jgi:hypothetical protein
MNNPAPDSTKPEGRTLRQMLDEQRAWIAEQRVKRGEAPKPAAQPPPPAPLRVLPPPVKAKAAPAPDPEIPPDWHEPQPDTADFDELHCAPAPKKRAKRTSLEVLRERSPMLARLVESTTLRKDAQRERARILLCLLDRTLPWNARVKEGSWYVQGACARASIKSIRAWYQQRWRSQMAPCLKTIKRHLAVLERFGAIVRAPGDWLEGKPQVQGAYGAYTERHGDTIYPMRDARSVKWWRDVGRDLLKLWPNARRNIDVWRAKIGDWRTAMLRWTRDAAGNLYDKAKALAASGMMRVDEAVRVLARGTGVERKEEADDRHRAKLREVRRNQRLAMLREEGETEQRRDKARAAWRESETIEAAAASTVQHMTIDPILCALYDAGHGLTRGMANVLRGDPLKAARAARSLAQALRQGRVDGSRAAWLVAACGHA